MIVEPESLPGDKSYRLISGVVVPRPVAWVSTLNRSGRVNLAPYSTFTFVSPRPPMIGISVGRRGAGHKDTANNILSSEEYVVHIADQPLTAMVHASSEELPEDVSEAELLGIDMLPGSRISVPRVAAAPIAMECRLRHVIEFGNSRHRFIVGEVVLYHIRDGLLRDGKIQTMDLNPICRLGGPNYATLSGVVTMPPVRQTAKSGETDQ